jgi:hypothetical protein
MINVCIKKITGRPSEDNLVKDCEYTGEMEELPSKNSRVWIWKGNIAYHTEVILWSKDEKLRSKNATYIYKVID